MVNVVSGKRWPKGRRGLHINPASCHLDIRLFIICNHVPEMPEKSCLLIKSMEKTITPKGSFGSQVRDIVSGVTSLSPLNTGSKHKVLALLNRVSTQLNVS